ncbi:GTP-binding protein [archaeon]|nr:GTP-binding protein [archaeon]
MISSYLKTIHKKLNSFLSSIFSKKKDLRLGLYGPPNAGKSTLANTISKDWLGEEMSSVSNVEHETREIILKDKIEISSNGKKLTFNLVDTPGIATKIDYENFVKKGITKKDAKTRAKEATKGVIEAIKWLDKMDVVIVVLDATKDPVDQVNVTILGNLEARGIPVLVAANKCDLKASEVTEIRTAFPQYEVVGISAKSRDNVDYLYERLFEVLK